MPVFQALSGSQMQALLRGLPAESAEPDAVDPALAEAVLVDHREDVFVPVVEAHRGRPSRDASLSATFDAAVDAVACALALQSRTAEWNAGLPESCRPLIRWTVTRHDETADAVPPCEPGGLAISSSVEAEVEATDRLLPPRDRYEADSAPTNATVLAPASSPTASPTDMRAATPGSGVPGVSLQPGGLLNGTYEIEELLASGGMGEVFRGREVHSGGEVAVKVIRLDMVHHPSALSLFQKEALTLRDINHDAIVRYYSFSFDPALRRHYLVMEFVDGPPLSRVFDGRPMSADAVAHLARRVASGLQLAHQRGIVHRDLSPDNIILPHGDPGHAKIIDFGIARAAQIGGGTIINGGFAGKHSYVSPEHLGLAGGEVTAKSDIYSLGIVLAEACLGRQLDMAGTHVEVIEKRRRVPDLSEVDPRLRGLIARMLDPDPERRPESMSAVEEAARMPVEVPASPTVLAARTARAPSAATAPRPIQRWIVGGGLAATLALGAGLFGYERLSDDGLPSQVHSPPRLQPAPQLDSPTLPSAEAGDATAPKPQAEPPQMAKPAPQPASPTLPSAEAGDAIAPKPQAEPPRMTKPAPQSASPTLPSAKAGDAIAPKPQAEPPRMAKPAAQPASPTLPSAKADDAIAPKPQAGPPQMAKLEPPPEPVLPVAPAPSSVPPSQSMADYVKAYDGGACFFLRPIRLTPTSAALDAFAQSRSAFDDLDRAFQNRFSVSPDIVGSRVWSRQCPALDFLRQAAQAGAASPRLFVKSARIGKGQSLAGEIRGIDGRAVALLIVGENGGVRDVTSALKPDGDVMTFELTPAPEGIGPAPELLVAVASPQPLPTPGGGGLVAAEPVFKALIDGAAHQGAALAADAKLFIVGG